MPLGENVTADVVVFPGGVGVGVGVGGVLVSSLVMLCWVFGELWQQRWEVLIECV